MRLPISSWGIEVDPDNDPPAAPVGYTIYVDEDSFTSSMVSAWDIDGDSLTYGVAPGGDPAHGTLDLNEWGSFSYTPFENYHGSDSFTFQVADPTGPPVTAEIMITVDPVNDAPTAGDDIATTDENQSIALSDLLANDADLDGDSLMVASFDSSTFQGGWVSDGGNGTLFYQPPSGFVGTDTFTYTATDGHGGYASATVTVTVLQQPEVWMDAPASLMENGMGEFTLHRNRSEDELTVTLTGYDTTAEPGDYALPGSVTFAEGVTSLPVLFQAHDDADPDDELFYPAISEAGSYAIGGMSCALVTILDDDPQNVWFDSSSATIIEPSSSGFSSSVELTLTRNTSEGELTVLYHVVGTAEAGDYTISPADSVTFYDGQSSVSLWITAEDDADGDDESVAVEVLEPDNSAYGGGTTFWAMIEDSQPNNDGNQNGGNDNDGGDSESDVGSENTMERYTADQYMDALIALRGLQQDLLDGLQSTREDQWVAGAIGLGFFQYLDYDWRPTIDSLKAQVASWGADFAGLHDLILDYYNGGETTLEEIQTASSRLSSRLAITDAYLRLIRTSIFAISSNQIVGEAAIHNTIIDHAETLAEHLVKLNERKPVDATDDLLEMHKYVNRVVEGVEAGNQILGVSKYVGAAAGLVGLARGVIVLAGGLAVESGGVGFALLSNGPVLMVGTGVTLKLTAAQIAQLTNAGVLTAVGTLAFSALPSEIGRYGEDAVPGAQNTGRIDSLQGTARYRVPDRLGEVTIGEIKNVTKLARTLQLRDYLAYAQKTGRTFELWVRATTKISGPLQDLIDAGLIIKKIIP